VTFGKKERQGEDLPMPKSEAVTGLIERHRLTLCTVDATEVVADDALEVGMRSVTPGSTP
jgi:hypothetical protein